MAEVGLELRLHYLITQSEGTCGSGFNLATAILLHCLGENDLHTTRSAAETRYRYKTPSYTKMQKAIQNNIRRKNLEKDGAIRGRKAYLGKNLKELLNERGRAKAILGLRLIKQLTILKNKAPKFGASENPHKIMAMLNNMIVNDLEILVLALEENHDDKTAELLKQMPAPVLEMFLWELGDNGEGASLAHLEDSGNSRESEKSSVPFTPEVILSLPASSGQPSAETSLAPMQEEPMACKEALTLDSHAISSQDQPDYERTAIPQKTSMFKKRFLAFTAVAICLSALASVFITDPAEVYRTVDEQGPEAALALSTGNDPAMTLSRAHAYYESGDLDTAEQMLIQVLTQTGLSEDHQTLSYNYLGQIAYDKGSYQEAIALFTVAFRRYKKNNTKLLNTYSVATNLARACLMSGDLNGTRHFLHKAKGFYKKSKVPTKSDYISLWHAIRFRLYLVEDKKEDALEAAREELKQLAPNNLNDQISAYSNLAFACMLNGLNDEAIFYMGEVDALLSQIGNQKKSMYHLPNWIYLRRCQGMDYVSMVDTVNNYLTDNYHSDLAFFLDYVQNTDCWDD